MAQVEQWASYLFIHGKQKRRVIGMAGQVSPKTQTPCPQNPEEIHTPDILPRKNGKNNWNTHNESPPVLVLRLSNTYIKDREPLEDINLQRTKTQRKLRSKINLPTGRYCLQ